jgi:hypothetical protein
VGVRKKLKIVCLLTLLSYLLIGFFIDIGFNNIIEGSNIAFEAMKIYFNFACLHRFTLNGPLHHIQTSLSKTSYACFKGGGVAIWGFLQFAPPTQLFPTYVPVTMEPKSLSK